MDKKNISQGVVHKVPADMAKTLYAFPQMLAVWEDITPLARNEWICWIEEAKKPETRVIRLEKMRSKMAKGMRRPCCWAGCPHR